MECQWTIEAPEESVVKLEFRDFDVESFDGDCDTDTVVIRDGRDNSSPLLGRVLCGQTIPEMLTSTGRYLTIQFTSDVISDGGRGFDANYVTLPGDCLHNAQYEIT